MYWFNISLAFKSLKCELLTNKPSLFIVNNLEDSIVKNFNDCFIKNYDSIQTNSTSGPVQITPTNTSDIQTKNEISDKMSKDLKKKGFKFVGTTICYAFMQATGLINDHSKSCFRYDEIKIL